MSQDGLKTSGDIVGATAMAIATAVRQSGIPGASQAAAMAESIGTAYNALTGVLPSTRVGGRVKLEVGAGSHSVFRIADVRTRSELPN